MQKFEGRKKAIAIAFTAILTFLMVNTAYANATLRPPTVSTWNQGQIGNVVRGNNIQGLNAPGRPNAINLNDFHTDIWDRFVFNYTFTSGPDFRHVLGSPTYVSASQVRRDPAGMNVRRDKNVAYTPLPYGIFSAIVDTYISNPYFASWVNEQGGLPFVLENPHRIPYFDTLMLGINMFNISQEQESFLPPTSIGN